MPNPINKAIQELKQWAGLTDKQAAALMPNGDDSSEGFPGVVIAFDPNEKSWVQQEYEKELKQYRDTPIR